MIRVCMIVCLAIHGGLSAYGEAPSSHPLTTAWEAHHLVAGGRIDAVAHVGEGVVLAGSRAPNPGRIFRSQDHGATWTEVMGIPRKLSGENVTCIASSPDGSVYLSTGSSTLWKSADRGVHWIELGTVSRNVNTEGAQLTYGVTVLPSGTLLVSDTHTPGGHVYRSEDGGSSWTDIGTLSPRALYRFEQFEGGVLVNGWEGNIYRSTDDGRTWRKHIVPGTAELFATEHLAAATLLQGSATGEVFASTDAGVTWELVANVGEPCDDLARLTDTAALLSTYNGTRSLFLLLETGHHVQRIGPCPSPVRDDILDHVISIPVDEQHIVIVGGTVQGYIVRRTVSLNAGEYTG